MVQWRSIPARSRRAPEGFIRPCQPILAHRVPIGPEWTHELKWDGYRIIARRDGDRVCLWSRNGRNWSDAFPRIAEAIERLDVDSVTIDGGAVCLLEDGRPDFHALRASQACRDARLVAFDLLALNGQDLRRMPLHERRKRLAALLSGWHEALWFSGDVRGPDGEALFRKACAMGLEGIVSKRIDSLYRSGPFSGWRKIKCPGYARP